MYHHSFDRLRTVCFAATLATVSVFTAPRSQAGVVYNQAYGLGSNPASQYGVGTAFDNFILTKPATIANVSWSGDHYPDTPIGSFTLTFYSDLSGSAGTALLSQSIPGNASEKRRSFSDPYETSDYAVDLPTPFNAAAGTRYWLSIVDDTPSGNPYGNRQWWWDPGVSGDRHCYYNYFGKRYDLGNDLAFSLSTTALHPIPEPGSLALLAVALPLTLTIRRRR